MNNSVTIKTDHKWHNFKYRNEVPQKILSSEFDHLSEEENFDGFLKYRGWWYHLSSFTAHDIKHRAERHQWHGYHADSYFSGVLIRVSDDGEQYQIGTYIS